MPGFRPPADSRCGNSSLAKARAMRHLRFGHVLLAAALGGVTVLRAASPPAAAAPADQHWAFLQQYCSKCHNAEDWAGGIAFDTMSPQEIPNDAKVWEHAVSKLRGRLMPPPGNPQPPNDRIHGF